MWPAGSNGSFRCNSGTDRNKWVLIIIPLLIIFFYFFHIFLAFLAKSSIQHAQIWLVSSSQTEREHAEAPLCRMSLWFSCSLTQLFGLFLCFLCLGFKVISDLSRIFTKKRKSQPSGEAQSNQWCSLCAALGKGLSGTCSSLRMPRHEPARSRHMAGSTLHTASSHPWSTEESLSSSTSQTLKISGHQDHPALKDRAQNSFSPLRRTFLVKSMKPHKIISFPEAKVASP